MSKEISQATEEGMTLEQVGEFAGQCGKNIDESRQNQDLEKKLADKREGYFKKIDDGQSRMAGIVEMRKLTGLNVKYKT